jgi:hypothetical protein
MSPTFNILTNFANQVSSSSMTQKLHCAAASQGWQIHQLSSSLSQTNTASHPHSFPENSNLLYLYIINTVLWEAMKN